MTCLGLDWGVPPEAVRERFANVQPVVSEDRVLVYPLPSIAEHFFVAGGFCPTAFLAGPERNGDEVTFGFAEHGLASTHIGFGYPFEAIGQKMENLSDSIMTAFARSEFEILLQEMISRHGPPAHISEQPARLGKLFIIATALFCPPENLVLRIAFGHDGGALGGEAQYLPRTPAGPGF